MHICVPLRSPPVGVIMKSLSRHILRALVAGAVVMLTLVTSSATCTYSSCVFNNNAASIESMKESITKGIEESVAIVKPVYDSRVKSYLKTYFERYPEYTERIIALSEIYFPLFEKYLEAYGLPTDLKYMAIVESGLQPSATSSVGAAGLWQFMPGTGQMFGLRKTKYLDERRDPEKSTEAAVKYLKQLYEKFGTWELAMAGYNAGPGRVNYAIRRSGSKDYWKLQRYLPRETRSYVPGFIAANYMMTHYEEHGLKPAELPRNFTNTAVVTLYEGMSFQDINHVTGVSSTMLAELNPKFSRRYVPSSVIGYDLVIPANGVAALMAHLEVPEDQIEKYTSSPFAKMAIVPIAFETQTVTHTYRVRSGDNLYRIAQNNGCSVKDLMRWNKLSGSTIKPNQRLMIKVTENVAVYPEQIEREIEPVAMLSSSATYDVSAFQLRSIPVADFLPKTVCRPDFPDDAMILKRRMSIKDLMTVNDIPLTILPKYSAVTPGAVVTLQ